MKAQPLKEYKQCVSFHWVNTVKELPGILNANTYFFFFFFVSTKNFSFSFSFKPWNFLKSLKTFRSNVNQSPQKTPFNELNLFFELVLCLSMFTAYVFLIFKAKSFEDLTNSIYVDASQTATFLSTSVLIWKAKKIFLHMEHFEIMVEDRE